MKEKEKGGEIPFSCTGAGECWRPKAGKWTFWWAIAVVLGCVDYYGTATRITELVRSSKPYICTVVTETSQTVTYRRLSTAVQGLKKCSG